MSQGLVVIPTDSATADQRAATAPTSSPAPRARRSAGTGPAAVRPRPDRHVRRDRRGAHAHAAFPRCARSCSRCRSASPTTTTCRSSPTCRRNWGPRWAGRRADRQWVLPNATTRPTLVAERGGRARSDAAGSRVDPCHRRPGRRPRLRDVRAADRPAGLGGRGGRPFRRGLPGVRLLGRRRPRPRRAGRPALVGRIARSRPRSSCRTPRRASGCDTRGLELLSATQLG